MSSPRQFGSAVELLRACREHGLLTRATGSGHWQILEDRAGFGVNKVVATIPGTTSDYRGLLNSVADIKRSTGIDIRFRPVKPVGLERRVEVEAPAPEPNKFVDERRLMERSELKELVRELIMELLTPPKPVVRAITEVRPSVYDAPTTRSKPVSVKPEKGRGSGTPHKKPHVMLTPEQIKEVVGLIDAGESQISVAKAFNIAQATASRFWRKAHNIPKGAPRARRKR